MSHLICAFKSLFYTKYDSRMRNIFRKWTRGSFNRNSLLQNFIAHPLKGRGDSQMNSVQKVIDEIALWFGHGKADLKSAFLKYSL